MKKEISVCDICNSRLAAEKCEICYKDLCSDISCGRKVNITFGSGVRAGTFFRCSKCALKMKKACTSKDPIFSENIRELVLKEIAKRIVADNLAEDDDETEE